MCVCEYEYIIYIEVMEIISSQSTNLMKTNICNYFNNLNLCNTIIGMNIIFVTEVGIFYPVVNNYKIS